MQPTPSFLVLTSLLASSVFAAQPPDVVQSDSAQNTAMGDGALFVVGPSTAACGGHGNTAAGYYVLANNTQGCDNTAVGTQALYGNTTGATNNAVGYKALYSNSVGSGNTADGWQALYSNAGGNENSGFGNAALEFNDSGNYNTAVGSAALSLLRSGDSNTAVGEGALANNAAGDNNTAVGSGALGAGNCCGNGAGSNNTASGYLALGGNTTGSSNSAMGVSALAASTTGSDNTAVGGAAMSHNVTGSNNVALGNNALKNASAGNGNIAVGYGAGDSLQKSNNIAIGNTGSSSDSGVTRIGTAGAQTAVYLAGVATTHVTGASVIVTSSGQLGVLASSERYKTAIAPIGAGTAKLEQLRPVSFHLKNDPRGAVQYGLIAEEVAKVYPELVIRNEAGGIEGVRYDELAPMLLNQVEAQAREIRELKAQFAEMRAALELNKAIPAAVAQR